MADLTIDKREMKGLAKVLGFLDELNSGDHGIELDIFVRFEGEPDVFGKISYDDSYGEYHFVTA